MEHTCRLCTIADTTLASIANYRLLDVEQEATIPLEYLIEQYLAININPSPFDALICADCLKRIEEWHTFRESCHQHNQLFLEHHIAFEEVVRSDTPYDVCIADHDTARVEDSEESKYTVLKVEQLEEHIEEQEVEEQVLRVHSETTCLTILPEPPVYTATEQPEPEEPQSEKEVPPPAVTKKKRGRPKKSKEQLTSSQQHEQPKRKHRALAKVCTICGVSRSDMAAHLRWHKNERPYQCPYCPKIFLNSSNLRNHVNLHTRDRMYKCDLCDKEFPSTTGRSKHRETHATERVHLCSVCGKSFKYRASLIRHKLIHFEEPKHKCTVCNMLFLTKSRLMKHALVHGKDKPFSCEICGKAFNRKDNLKTHKKTHIFGRGLGEKGKMLEERMKRGTHSDVAA